MCVSPFSEEGGDVVHEHGGHMDCCRDVCLDLHVFIVGGCVRVCHGGCGCTKHACLVWPAPAPARSEAPVICKVAKGEWRTCEQQKKKTKKGC